MAAHVIGCTGGTVLHVIHVHMTSSVHTWSLQQYINVTGKFYYQCSP